MQNAVTDAVRRLRLALGDTQQQFAHRTGLAISTVVRYELSRPPRGKALAQFAVLAERKGLHDLARTFAYAHGQKPETAPLHAAIDSIWYNREHLRGYVTVVSMIEDELKRLLEVKRAKPDAVVESVEDLEEQLAGLREMLSLTSGDQANEAKTARKKKRERS